MITTEHLQALGKEALYIETVYLNLKIEKALKGDDFTREAFLAEAECLWHEINTEYHGFLNYLQTSHPHAA